MLKTQTRRVVKQPTWVTEYEMLQLAAQRPATGLAYYVDGRPRRVMTCPYGGPGDFLWVRETWATPRRNKSIVWYRASHVGVEPKWRSPRFMPRRASRISLRVEAVRVERLQAITANDCEAEGVPNTPRLPRNTLAWALWHTESFRELWSSINGAESWDANPWVWVVTFSRVDSIPEGATARPIPFTAPMVRAILGRS